VGLYLGMAILCEVAGTLSLRLAANGERRWFIAVVVGYISSFIFLTLTLQEGLALGVAYGIWAATGVAAIAVASRVLFNEPLTRPMIVGLGLIASGVLLVELGSWQ
jgi:small multidrug resistance pump